MKGIATISEHRELEKKLLENKVCVATYAMIDMNLSTLPKGMLHDSNVAANFDSDESKWGKVGELGVVTLSPDEAAAYADKVDAILIMSQNLKPIAKRLDELGVKKYYSTFGFESHEHETCRFTLVGAQQNPIFVDIYRSIYDKHKDDMASARSLLCDDLSIKIFDALIAERLELREDKICSHLGPLTSTMQSQYFPEDLSCFSFTEEEIMVDCGPCNGNDIMRLMDRTRGKYRHVYAFEPDRRSYMTMRDFANEHKDITVRQKAVSEKSGFVSFNERANRYLSCVCDDEIATYKVPKCALDDEIDGPVTFIKMDIEGDEVSALNGAKRLIQTFKPKLAISVYHKIADLWEIPLLMKKFVPEYEIYIRHHMPISPTQTAMWDTVAYAVIKD